MKRDYDYILIDCMPSLGMLTINALAAADSVLIPAQPQFLSAKGLEQLLQTVNKVRRQINRNLRIDGILLTMADNRTNYSKEVSALLRSTYGSRIKVFDTEIPRSIRAAEISAEGKSIYAHDPHGKVAEAYRSLTGEVLKIAPTTSFDRSSSVENRSSREVRLMFFALLFNLQHLPRERAVCLCHFPVGIVSIDALALGADLRRPD